MHFQDVVAARDSAGQALGRYPARTRKEPKRLDDTMLAELHKERPPRGPREDKAVSVGASAGSGKRGGALGSKSKHGGSVGKQRHGGYESDDDDADQEDEDYGRSVSCCFHYS